MADFLTAALILEAKGLVKRYGEAVAVAGVDMTVHQGEVIGLLGPNGAGKTTTILMLLGLTEASDGEVSVLGKDPLRQPLEVKREVGYLPDAVGFYDTMTGRENLVYTGKLAGLSRKAIDHRIDAALERVRLSDAGRRRVSTYSRGMRQRLGIAELLMRDCKVMILDEPTSGLDPQSTHELLELIQQLASEGITILLSSHQLDVVQAICSRVALFNKGRIGFFGTVDELAQQIGRGAFIVDVEAGGIDLTSLAQKADGVASVAKVSDGVWQVEATRDVRPELAKIVVDAGGSLRNLDLRRARLNEAYNRYFTEVANAA